MSNKNDRWSALSLKDRADLMNMYITNGISDLKEMKKHYNGIPYRDLNTSDYDYFNASPEMIPTEEGQHWDSRNPHTGQILKSENHPTFDLAVEGEKNAGYKIVRGYDNNLYSIPSQPDNYVEKHNILDGTEKEQTITGLPVGAGQDTYNHPKYNHAEEVEMYSYLRSRGVPHVQASAIMGNIAVESMLNPEITQIGGGGGYGLIQATDRSRKKAFINYDGQPYEFGSNISPETQRQLDYIIDKGLNTQTKGEWRGNHNISRASVARKKFLEATDVNKASTIFTENYLRPGKPHTKRRKSMSNYFNDNYGITERALEEFENSFLFQNN